MLDEERTELENWKSEYVSIGISDGGNNRVGAIPVPWENDGARFQYEDSGRFYFSRGFE